ncbi:DUF1877 family protein [Chamaesiphon polymorphus]|nr:DUF1877 family protein [Chamaesiphon polymorphus]
MGYQAIPNCQLLARSRQEPNFGEHLQFFELYLSDSEAELEREREVDEDEEDYQLPIEFVKEACKLIQQYPDLEHRNLHIGRVWDKFYYLLSPGRRNCEEVAESDWVKKAIFGGSPLNETSKTVIDSHIFYLDPSEVNDIEKKLQITSIEMFSAHWNPLAMSQASVYKIHDRESDEYFHYLQEEFQRFKDFYTLVSSHDEGIITCLS